METNATWSCDNYWKSSKDSNLFFFGQSVFSWISVGFEPTSVSVRMDLTSENVTVTYSCDECDDDFECKMCDISCWPYFQFDSLNMPDLDIAIKTIGMNLYWLNQGWPDIFVQGQNLKRKLYLGDYFLTFISYKLNICREEIFIFFIGLFWYLLWDSVLTKFVWKDHMHCISK